MTSADLAIVYQEEKFIIFKSISAKPPVNILSGNSGHAVEYGVLNVKKINSCFHFHTASKVKAACVNVLKTEVILHDCGTEL